MDISVALLNTSIVDEDEINLGYTLDDIKSFLDKSFISWWFPFVNELKDDDRLMKLFVKSLSSCKRVSLKELLDLFTLSIMMMSYQKDNSLLMKDRLKLIELVSQLPVALDTEGVQYIVIGLHKNLVNEALGRERLERVMNIHAAIPTLVKSSKLGNDIAMAILLTIMSKYTKVEVHFTGNNAYMAFALAKQVKWQELANSKRHADMFMLIRTFSLIINCRSSREECTDWRKLCAEIHKYFLKMSKAFDNSVDNGNFEMMIERFIAYCVVRGVTTSPQICDFKV